MATQYTSILKLALPTEGELSGTWGDVVNDNITSMVEEAIAGRAVINTWTTNSHTLTTADGTTAEARCAMLEFTDTGTALSGAGTVICPTASKIYIAKNDAGQAITLKTSAGTGIAVPDGETMFLFCDGTNVVEAITSVKTLKIADGVQINTILDEDDLVSDSATALATQQSIKAYVDAQVTAQDLDIAGDSGTGAIDLDSQSLTVAGTSNEVETSASGQTITVGLPSAVIVTTSVTTPTVQATNINANDGSTSATIADVTGVMTIASSVLTTTDINGGTVDGTTIGGSTAAAGTFTTATATTGVVTDTISERTATSGVTIDGVVLKDNGITATGGGSLTGTWSDLGSVTTVDINGGTIDGVTIGGASAGAGTFSGLTVNSGATDLAATFQSTDAGVVLNLTDDTTTLQFGNSAGTFQVYGNVSTFPKLLSASESAFVINDDSNDIDFRVESDTNTHALFVDAGTNAIGVGLSSTTAVATTSATSLNVGGVLSVEGTLNSHQTNKLVLERNGNVSAVRAYGATAGDGAFRIQVGGGGGLTDSEVARFEASTVTFNENGNDVDFRVESDGQSNMLFVDAAEDAIAMKTGAPSDATLTVFGSAGTSYNAIQIRNSNASNTAKGGIISFAQYDDAATSWTGIGGFDSGSDRVVYIGGGSWVQQEATKLVFFAGVYDAGTGAAPLRLEILNDETVINNPSANHDFRVESDNNANMLFVDASTDAVGIGGAPVSTSQLTAVADDDTNIALAGDNYAVWVQSALWNTSLLGGAYWDGGAKYGVTGRGATLLSIGHDADGTPSVQGLTISAAPQGTADTTPTFENLASITRAGTVFNEDGNDRDFRVESGSNSSQLFVDAGTNTTAVGTSTTSTATGSDTALLVNSNGQYNGGKQAAIFQSSTRGTVRVRSTGDNPAELFWDVDGGIRWLMSCRGSTQSNVLNWYGEAAVPNLTTVGSSLMSLTQSGNLSVSGSLSKGSGSFKIAHPLPAKSDTHDLVHSFVEAPQADNIYRGKVDLVAGQAVVNIDTVAGMTDGTFAALNREIQCFTSNETGWTAVRGSVSGNILTVEAQDNTCTDTISWMVVGERKDQHMYDTDWTDENGKVIVEPEKVTEEAN